MQESGIAQLISAAERHISARRYELALDKLSLAQHLEPKNLYIRAIIERVHTIQTAAASPKGPELLRSVTVGPEFQNGIKKTDDELSPHELKERIQELTSDAEEYLAKGSVSNAFELLMKAYLIDPTSPNVIACETRVLPAWNHLQKKPVAVSPLHNQSPDGKTMSDQNARLEILKKQREAERLEKERSLWTQASKPILTFGEGEATGEGSQSVEPPKPAKTERGLFFKLRLGKFLG